MGRKGISPLIAAVLLIAFTMAVASIFAQWAPGLIQDAQANTQQKTQDVRNCSSIVMDINTANTTHATIKQVSGDDPVGQITITWFYDDANPTQEQSSLTGFNRNVTNIYNGNSSGESLNTLSRVQAVPENCEGAPEAEYTP